MSNAPVQQFRIGFVTANIWANERNGNTFYNVTLTRTYKDGGEYKQTDSLSHGDLLNGAKVLEQSCDWIGEQ